jgi:queuine tRNA-ribosyltransferase
MQGLRDAIATNELDAFVTEFYAEKELPVPQLKS